MLTEQNPPWAAKFGVPNCWAHQPVNACDWSRPVKNASFFGSLFLIGSSQSVAIDRASSQVIGSNLPDPLGPTLFIGDFKRAGE